MELIDRSAIVAEIDNRIKKYILLQQKPEMSDLQKELQNKIDCLNSIKGYILNTLEVKEVDLDREIEQLNNKCNNMFISVRIYCNANKCCFDDILKSHKPWVVINRDQISSLGPKTDWGMCDGHSKYPYRVLKMCNGDSFLCVLESADILEKIINPQGCY